MPVTPETLYARLDELGIAYTHHEHPPVYTVAEASTFYTQIPGGHCKNLFLRDRKKSNWLVVAQHDTPLELKRLNELLQTSKLTLGRPERLWEILGVIPGAVTPFALLNDVERQVRVVVERRLLEHDTLNFHPLVNTVTTGITPEDLLRFLEAEGYSPRVLDLSPDSPP